MTTGDLEGARRCAERALAIQERMYGPEHHLVSGGLNALARVGWREGNVEDARRLYERSVRVLEHGLGPDHPQVAFTLGYLGWTILMSADAGEALPLFEREQGILENVYGYESARAAEARLDVAWARVRLGEVHEAHRLYRSGIATVAETLEAERVDVARRFFNLGCLATLVGESEEALSLRGRFPYCGSGDSYPR